MRTINAKSASNPYAVSRRTFLRATGAFASAVAFAHVNRALSADKLDGKIMTVLGPIAPEQLGVTLPHEHAVVDFLGAEKVRAIFTQLLPDLRKSGFDENEIRRLTITNPAEAFTIRVRKE